MTQESVRQNLDAQEKPLSRGGITDPQEWPNLPKDIPASITVPKSLVEWLARINRRYLALNQEEGEDTS